MLWTDTIFVTSQDLLTLDSDVSNVAVAEGITLDGVNGSCQRSIEKAGFELLALNIAFDGFLAGGDVTPGHMAAVFNTGTFPSVQRPMIRLSNVVVDDANNPQAWSVLKRWVAYKCLAGFFSQAENSNMKTDRYTLKAERYGKESKWTAWPTFVRQGCPATWNPLYCPASMFEYNTGSWIAAAQSTVASTIGGSFLVALSYVDQSKYISAANTANAESALSAPISVAPTSQQVISWNIAGLNPPTGVSLDRDKTAAVITPGNATGYNVYVAVAAQPTTWFLQNSSPIPIATLTGALAGDPVLAIPAGKVGQYPDVKLAMPVTRQRA